MRRPRTTSVRAVLMCMPLMWASRPRTLESTRFCRRRTAPRRARVLASTCQLATRRFPAAAVGAATGAARPGIPTRASSSPVWRWSRRRIQTSTLSVDMRQTAATRAACRRTNGTARGRPPVIKLHCISCRRPHNKKEEKPATALLPMKGGVVAAPRRLQPRRALSRRS